MDFRDQIKLLGDRVLKLKDQIQTEEATKTAFIMPFIQALGYDVFNPLEVVPEYISDVGLKKGEKIDYAIIRDGAPIILIECKHLAQSLDLHDGQLLRYFHVSKAKFGILTNGVIYRFYSDLVEPNKMDEKPFLEINITDIKDVHVEELKKFHKSVFDAQKIFTTAAELKFMNELRQLISSEVQSPSSDFVRHFARQVYTGNVSAKVLEQFTSLTKRAFQQYISDLITERLKTALSKEDQTSKEQEAKMEQEAAQEGPKVITTDEEIEAYNIVKAILRSKVDVKRITHRDAQSYFSIFLDDNNRKPICRLFLNGAKKYMVVYNEARIEAKCELSTVDDIFKFGEHLIISLNNHLKAGPQAGSGD